MEKDNSKIITVSFVIAGFLAFLVVSVLLDALATAFGPVARVRANPLVNHGLPVVVGLVTFGVLQFKSSIRTWADEVVVEVRKVVWPSVTDTRNMTIVVCIMLLMSGVILGVFDYLSGEVIRIILN